MSPSAGAAAEHGDVRASRVTEGLEVGHLAVPGLINLRGDPARLSARLTQKLPLAPRPNTIAQQDLWTSLGLGPDEWLLLGPPDRVADVLGHMTALLADCHASIVDVTDQWQLLELAGDRKDDLLSALSPLDPALLSPGRCAQTLMAKAAVVLFAVEDGRAYRFLVRSSFARYLIAAIRDQAALIGG